ncbi:Helicase associated domain protein [Streptomyces cadmiisoli]|uniref:helicase associated domain-containing protein n=1 Tax=Streptomyces cadmiisoli TaxID=2184053 RepID=UPI003D75B5F2
MELRPHQSEAVDSVLRFLSVPSGGRMPAEGLRTQVISATGSGKTLVAVESAHRLSAHRVLVLVPTLDLLTQMARAWRGGGRRGAMVGVCSLRAEESDGVPCTTDPDELVAWLGDLEVVTVFATYASVGMGILQRAHEAGLPVWDLMVVDEAHRTSGDVGKAWAAVHDQSLVPAVRRLYMTATARVWEAGDGGGGGVPRLVASMDEDSPVFGPVAYRLKLSEAIRLGIVAPYQVVCLDIRDPQLHAALVGEAPGTDAARGARLAAVQTGLMRAAVDERFRRVLSFHSRVSEAEAMAASVPKVAARLAEDDPGTFPPAEQVWADWLYGEHTPGHRQQVLDEFASDFLKEQGSDGRDVPAVLRVLSSVRVLGEGVDTPECDAVLFADARGSMVDIVQMVGRALRITPGAGKLATLVVPVFLAPDEDPDELLTSDAYGTLTKVLGALRAHDTETIEALADPRVRSGPKQVPVETEATETAGAAEDSHEAQAGARAEAETGAGAEAGARAGAGMGVGVGAVAVGRAAAGVLRFSEERDPAALAQYIRLRIIDPEGAYWRRGIEAATRWLRETSSTELRVPYTYTTPEDWPGVGGYPLGVWIADQRRYYTAETLEASRVAELDALGMVWSAQASAWDSGLAVARAYAAAHDGLLLPPADAVWDGYPIGTWVKNQRAAARRTLQNAERRAAGETGVPYAGELSESRMEAMEAIDPGWCPRGWDITWQRCFRLTQTHLHHGGTLPTATGELIVQGEDLAEWVTGQRRSWDTLRPSQRWLLETILELQPLTPEEAAAQPTRRTQTDRWTTHLAAARQFHHREGHLHVPRKHIEELAGDDSESGTPVRLGTWLDNTRRRADKLNEQRRNDLNALGMRW